MFENLQMLYIHLPVLVIGVVFHEYAHGYMAERWGDLTAKAAGRITLNPIPHIDPVGTLLFPGVLMFMGVPVLFGWAKPVPINPNAFRSYRPGLFWVAFAGPLMNFTLAFLSALIFCFFLRFVSPEFYLFEPLVRMAKFSIYLNLVLGVFNLMPLPPLDGSKMIQSFLSMDATEKYERISQYSFFILMGLIFTGVLKYLLYPAYAVGDFMVKIMMDLFGLTVYLG